MALNTIPLDDITVMLRKPFEMLKKDESPVADNKTGQLIYMAQAVCGGLLSNTFQPLTDQATEVRIKILGQEPRFAAGTMVKLTGAQLTTWYVARAQGNAAKSDVTISCTGVELSNDGPNMVGGLPANTGGIGVTMLYQTFRTQNSTSTPDKISISFDPEGVFQVTGVTEAVCTNTVDKALYGKKVRPIGLKAYFIIPDSPDVNQRAKAQLVLACSGVEEAPTAKSNGKHDRPAPTPTPDEQPVG